MNRTLTKDEEHTILVRMIKRMTLEEYVVLLNVADHERLNEVLSYKFVGALRRDEA